MTVFIVRENGIGDRGFGFVGPVIRCLVLLPVFCLILSACAPKDPPRPAAEAEVAGRTGTALIITGAAARIPQEAALLQELDARGLLKEVVFISGVSSGALNAVALNGILSNKITWARYREILFSIRNEDVFIREGKRLPVDTEPARSLFRHIVEDELGYRTIGELPFTTSLTVTRLRDLGLSQTAYRLCSRPINPESDPSLRLVDILAATTAIPLVFPPARIPGVRTIPDIEYVDGGASEDYVPYEALLEFERFRGRGVARVYIISRKTDRAPDISEELLQLGVNDHRLLDYLGVSFDTLADRKFRKSLDAFEHAAPETASRALIWKPDFQEDFLLMDFNSLEIQYGVTSEWAKRSNPVPIHEYQSGSSGG